LAKHCPSAQHGGGDGRSNGGPAETLPHTAKNAKIPVVIVRVSVT